MIVLIDSGVLGKLCNPNSSAEVETARERLYALLAKGVYIVSSQICDYEVRRSLILNSLRGLTSEGIDNLNKLAEFIELLYNETFFSTDEDFFEAVCFFAAGELDWKIVEMGLRSEKDKKVKISGLTTYG